jgi:hypothetical protein
MGKKHSTQAAMTAEQPRLLSHDAVQSAEQQQATRDRMEAELAAQRERRTATP